LLSGQGAGGMMAAGRASESGASVLLLEKTEQPGKKILISGKTRCNLTNSKELDEFITMYGDERQFPYTVLSIIISVTSCWNS
jgi:predicted flavoprotein YhiN